MEKYNILKELKGGSFSSTLVVEIDENSKRVRKFISRDDNREYGLVRWQSQVRRMQHLHLTLPKNTPPILNLGVEKNFFYYDIPFYDNSQNLHDYLLDKDEVVAGDIFENLLSLMSSYQSQSYGEVKGSFAVFFAEEVIGRLQQASEDVNSCFLDNKITQEELNLTLKCIDDTFEELETILSNSQMLSIHETLTHGNLTLENVLFDKSKQRIILIDPYSETYTDSILGDFSQLLQSSVSKYEQIMSNGEAGIKKFFKTDLPEEKTGVDYFGLCLERHIASMSHKDRVLLNLFHAAQFIRMFPFKIGKTPRLAIYFLLHGLKLINEGKKYA
jgi:hypothetical protein